LLAGRLSKVAWRWRHRIFTDMNIADYIASFHSKNYAPKADIVERWNTRVVAQGLHEQGGAGAEAYLARYGKGISAKKVADLALMAEHSGAPDMAAGFWEKAYQIEMAPSKPLAGGKQSVTAGSAGKDAPAL